ncbi:MAG: DUF4184 family protein [Anaerolineae bacterium]|nr:DUF4184 family protein [Anaerolineae bacterium]
MPFTLSHPAVVVPLPRKKLILSALVIGSMAPDFEYFVPWQMQDRFGHSLEGIFLFSIPAAFVVFVCFHLFFKHPLLSLFPYAHQARLISLVNDFSFGPISRFFWAIISLIVGVFSHIFLDSFTHQEGRGAYMIPVLKQIFIKIGQSNIPLYAILQYVCSALGIILLVYWYIRWYLKEKPRYALVKNRLPIWLHIFIFSIFIGSSFLLSMPVTRRLFMRPFSFKFLYDYFHDVAIVILSVLLIEILLYCIIWQVIYRSRQLFVKLSR